jgi:hypothetical protein
MLEEIITPIHKHQVQAQFDRAHVGCVRGRWNEIWQHLKQCQQRQNTTFTAALWQTLEARKKRTAYKPSFSSTLVDAKNRP